MALCEDFLLAGYNVTHQNFIHLNKNMDVTTRESYQDALISTHFAVIIICYMRENFPNTPCRLDLTGSDPCECLFSLTGQWVGNRHNYSFGEVLDNINNMMRLQIMQANPNGPKVARGHKNRKTSGTSSTRETFRELI